MTLDELRPGQRGIVVGWTSSEPPTRLLELGILAGTRLEVVRLAPLGDPIDVKIRGYHLSIRKQEAEQIKVRPA